MQVRRHYRIPIGFRFVEYTPADDGDASVVNKHIDATQLALNLGHRVSQRGPLSHVKM